jgi:Lar family restriction alleviation protein
MELKPCPFCGEIPYLERKPLWQTHGNITHGYFGCFEYDIRCHVCGCNIPLKDNTTIYLKDEEAKKNAIEQWNTRVI